MKIGKNYTFESAHFLPNHNRCGNMHGHTYTLTVMITGEIQDNGMVYDFHLLNDYVKPIIAKLDHGCINDLLETPTAENIILWIALELYTVLNNTTLDSFELRLQEGPGGFADIWVDLTIGEFNYL